MNDDAKRPKAVNFEIVEESALARAQVALFRAMDASQMKQADLARRLEKSPAYVSQLLDDGRNLTLRTFARALAACGMEFRFDVSPIEPAIESPAKAPAGKLHTPHRHLPRRPRKNATRKPPSVAVLHGQKR